MNVGSMVTVVLTVAILGYGLYALIKSVKKTSKGECVGCSGCSHSGSCSMSNEK